MVPGPGRMDPMVLEQKMALGPRTAWRVTLGALVVLGFSTTCSLS